jgi:hypothetical protein
MATEKLFTVCGTSVFNGEHKVRWANDVFRAKALAKCGNTDIILVELPEAMTKQAAAEFIRDLPEFASDVQQATIADYLEGTQEKPAKEPRVKRERKVKAKDEEKVESVDIESEEDDDLPIGYEQLQSELDEAPF